MNCFPDKNKNPLSDEKGFKYKTGVTGQLPANGKPDGSTGIMLSVQRHFSGNRGI